MNEQSFGKKKYGKYPRNEYLGDLPIEYEQRVFTKLPIDCSTENTVEMLKVSSIKISFDNWMYVSNHRNANYNDLTFDVYQVLITRRQIYRINDDIVEILNKGSIVDVYTNWM